MTKENEHIATVNDLMTKIENISKIIEKDRLLFFGDLGKELILLTKELHVQGAAILRSKNIDASSKEFLKKIPVGK